MRYTKKLRTTILLATFCIAGFSSAVHAEIDFKLRGGYVPSGDYTLSFDNDFGKSLLKYRFSYTAIPVGATLLYSMDGEEKSFLDVFHQSSTGKSKSNQLAQPINFSSNENALTFGLQMEGACCVYVRYKTFEVVTTGLQQTLPDKIKGSDVAVGIWTLFRASHSAIDFDVALSVSRAGSSINDSLDRIAVGYTYSFSKHFGLSMGYTWEWNSFKVSSSIDTCNYDYGLAICGSVDLSKASVKLSQAALTAAVTF